MQYTTNTCTLTFICNIQLKPTKIYVKLEARKLSIESRLSTLSFNEKMFQEAVTPYQDYHKHYKILAIDKHSPINVLKTITTTPTQIKLNKKGNNK